MQPLPVLFNTVPIQELGQLLPEVVQTFGNTFFLLGADRVWPHQMFDIAGPMSKAGRQGRRQGVYVGHRDDFTPVIDHLAAGKAKVLLLALKGEEWPSSGRPTTWD